MWSFGKFIHENMYTFKGIFNRVGILSVEECCYCTLSRCTRAAKAGQRFAILATQRRLVFRAHYHLAILRPDCEKSCLSNVVRCAPTLA